MAHRGRAPRQHCDVAVESLVEQLKERCGLNLETRGQGKAVALIVQPGAVETDARVATQAYRLTMSDSGIRIIANASPGLFYGVQTLAQLAKSERGKWWLPEGEIVDWPNVALREVFWDEQEHLDHFDIEAGRPARGVLR